MQYPAICFFLLLFVIIEQFLFFTGRIFIFSVKQIIFNIVWNTFFCLLCNKYCNVHFLYRNYFIYPGSISQYNMEEQVWKIDTNRKIHMYWELHQIKNLLALKKQIKKLQFWSQTGNLHCLVNRRWNVFSSIYELHNVVIYSANKHNIW